MYVSMAPASRRAHDAPITVYASERLSRSASKRRPPSPLATADHTSAACRAGFLRSGPGKTIANALWALVRDTTRCQSSAAGATRWGSRAGGEPAGGRSPNTPASSAAAASGSRSPTTTTVPLTCANCVWCHDRTASGVMRGNVSIVPPIGSP